MPLNFGSIAPETVLHPTRPANAAFGSDGSGWSLPNGPFLELAHSRGCPRNARQRHPVTVFRHINNIIFIAARHPAKSDSCPRNYTKVSKPYV
jgi:hypothetical protein